MGTPSRHERIGRPGRPTRPSAAEINRIAARLQRRRTAERGGTPAVAAPAPAAGRPAAGGEAKGARSRGNG